MKTTNTVYSALSTACRYRALMFVAALLLALPVNDLCFGGVYTNFIIIATNGQAGITGILGGPSINNNGLCAFATQVSGGETIYAGDGAGNPTNLTSFIAANRSFSSYLQINDAGLVAAEDTVSGLPPFYVVREWNANIPDDFTIIAFNHNNTFSIEPSINNSGQVAYLGFDGSSYTLYSTNAAGPQLFYQSFLGNNLTRPLIADNGSVVGKLGSSTTSGSIRVFNNTLASFVDVAVAGSGGQFSSLDSFPGISEDGQVVAFYGVDSDGPGIFITVASNGNFTGSPPFRIAGSSNGFSNFATFSRVAVKTIPGGDGQGNVVFLGTQSNSFGLYALGFQSEGQTNEPIVSPPSLVIAEGQTLSNLSGTIESLSIQDPLNAAGSVAFYASTSAGIGAVISAPATPGISITTRSRDDTSNVPPVIEPSILRIPNKIAQNWTSLKLTPPNPFAERSNVMLLKIHAPAFTHLVAYITPIPNTGGHDGADHPTSVGRPHGWLSTNYMKNFPPVNLQANFQSSGTTQYSDFQHGLPLLTSEDGTTNLYYYAPELSCQESVTVTNSGSGMSASVQISVGFGLPKLPAPTIQPFAALAESPSISLVGQKISSTGQSLHPNNHYGTPALINALTVLGANWAAQFQRDSDSLPQMELPVNDMSLVNGGEFDIHGKWYVDKKGLPTADGHKGHRIGIEVDIGDTSTDGGISTFLPVPFGGKYANRVWAKTFDQMYSEEGWFSFLSEGPGLLYHLIVTGTGRVSIDFPDPAQVTAWDGAQNATVRVPMINRGGLNADSVTITSIAASDGVTVSASSLPAIVGSLPVLGIASVDVQVQVPAGVNFFFLYGAGESASGTSVFPVPGTKGLAEFYMPVDLSSFSATPMPTAPRPQIGGDWQLILSDADQPAVTNGTVVYHGSIINNTGGDIVLSVLDLSFAMAAAPGAYQYTLAPEFLNTGGLIPANGYTGPLFVVTWSDAPSVGSFGSGSLSLTAETNLNLEPVSASFSSSYEPQILSAALEGTNLLVSWSLEGTGLELQSIDSLDDLYPEWDEVTAQVIQTNGQNTVTLPATDPTGFFQLVAP